MTAPKRPRKPSQATQLVDLALRADVELFHTPQGEAYAVVESQGHRETWAVNSRGFRLWLAGRYYAATRGTANAQATADAIRVLEARARFDGATVPVFTRLGERDGTLYLDLADDAWRAVEVTAEGWRIEERAPVRFRRPLGMQPLPAPETGGRLDAVREFVNVDDDGWTLAAGWLVGTLRPDRPFPILAIHGEPGSGKTTQGEMLRAIVDPNVGLLRAPPREEVDLILQAINGWIVGYDNVSALPEWLLDALCRLSTGAGFSRRQLYTNDEEALFSAKRPIVYTAIAEVGVRGDLSDRSIGVMLPRLARHRTVDEVWAAFHRAWPRVLGALLDAAVGALRALPTTTLAHPPRMHDFACWVTAAETALGWAPRTFLGVYDRSREAAHQVVLESSAVGQAILSFMRARATWTGKAKSLLVDLDAVVDDATRRDRHWPQGSGGPRRLGGILRTIAPNLRGAGLEVEYVEGGGETKRQWTLRWAAPPQDGSAVAADGRGTVAPLAESAMHSGPCPNRDGSDGRMHTLRNGDLCWSCGEVGTHDPSCSERTVIPGLDE